MELELTEPSPCKTRRPKRKQEVIKQALYTAITEIINDGGFPALTMQNLSLKSDVAKNLIYKYYTTLDNLLEEYFNQNDFWFAFSHLIANRYSSKEEFFKGILKELYEIMNNNIPFQCIIRWEVAAPNKFIKEKSQNRESFCQDMLEQNENYFQLSGVDIKAVYAVLIAGIYYLILRKDISTFCGIDFTKPEGRERLFQTIDLLAGLLIEYHFSKISSLNPTQIHVARKLLKQNASIEYIAELLEVEKSAIDELAGHTQEDNVCNQQPKNNRHK